MLHDANRRTKNVQDGCRATAAWLGTRVAVAWKVPERASERARHQRLGVVPKRGQRNKLARNYGNTFSCCRPNSLRAIETNKTGLVGGWWLVVVVALVAFSKSKPQTGCSRVDVAYNSHRRIRPVTPHGGIRSIRGRQMMVKKMVEGGGGKVRGICTSVCAPNRHAG